MTTPGDDPTPRINPADFDRALALLGLPPERDGAYLTKVTIEAGLVTGTYTVIGKVGDPMIKQTKLETRP